MCSGPVADSWTISTASVPAWYVASKFQTELAELNDELFELVNQLPVAVVIFMLPLFLMKLCGRWKLVSTHDETRANDPSISSILAMTALVGASVACLRNLDGQFGSGTIAETSILFLYHLVLPGLTMGAVIAACLFAVLGQGRSPTKIASSFALIIILFVVIAPASLSVLANWILAEDTVDQEFWILIFYQQLGPFVVGIVFGLPIAFWLRMLGYRLWTRGGLKSRQDPISGQTT